MLEEVTSATFIRETKSIKHLRRATVVASYSKQENYKNTARVKDTN